MNFIWDLDGTLIDSYGVMVDCLHTVISEQGIDITPEFIMDFAKKQTIGSLYREMERLYSADIPKMQHGYKVLSDPRYDEILPENHAGEILAALRDNGHRNFVYTHRDSLAIKILDNLDFSKFFEEIATCEMNLGWKPAPDAIYYFINKYGLEPSETFYVGDRTIDIECGVNAGIKTIFYHPEGSPVESCGKEDFQVKDLMDILEVIK